MLVAFVHGSEYWKAIGIMTRLAPCNRTCFREKYRTNTGTNPRIAYQKPVRIHTYVTRSWCNAIAMEKIHTPV